MQQWHKEEQWLLVCLEEAAEVCHIKYVAQKARRETEAKAKKEVCRREGEEKEVGVYPMTLGQGDSRGCCPLGEY